MSIPEREGSRPSSLPVALQPIDGKIKLRAYDPDGTHIGVAANSSGHLIIDTTGGVGRVVDGIAIPSTQADVWTPGLAATVYMDVEFEFVNMTAADDVLERFGIDYANNSDAINRYLASWDIPIRTGEVGPRIGPFRIGGNDAIRAEAKTASTIEMHVYIIKEGTAA